LFYKEIKIDLIISSYLLLDIMPKKQNKQVQRYIKTLDKDSLRALEIAQEQLETSFNIQKSIGFKKWIAKNKK